MPNKRKYKPDIYDVEHPDRQKATIILDEICDKVKFIKGELWFELEDFITFTINGKKYE